MGLERMVLWEAFNVEPRNDVLCSGDWSLV